MRSRVQKAQGPSRGPERGFVPPEFRIGKSLSGAGLDPVTALKIAERRWDRADRETHRFLRHLYRALKEMRRAPQKPQIKVVPRVSDLRDAASEYDQNGSPIAQAYLIRTSADRAAKLGIHSSPITRLMEGLAGPRRVDTRPHFRHSEITRGNARGRSVTDPFAASSGTAAAHQRYIERGGAEAAAATSVEQAGASHQRYIERRSDDPADAGSDDVVAVLGNLAPTFERRCRVWRDIR